MYSFFSERSFLAIPLVLVPQERRPALSHCMLNIMFSRKELALMDAEKEMEERKEKEKDEEANINFLKESIGSKVCTFLKMILYLEHRI